MIVYGFHRNDDGSCQNRKWKHTYIMDLEWMMWKFIGHTVAFANWFVWKADWKESGCLLVFSPYPTEH